MNENINAQSMLPVGTMLQMGKYRIERYLSSGGFGNTYVAYNTEFRETVAIKEFFMRGVTQRDGNTTTVSVSNGENSAQFAEQLEKFKKEARRIRRLHNDHIVAVHDLFVENGTAYYVMDYVDGESLSERVKRTGAPIDESRVRAWLPQILDALTAVHSQGIWHLDLKPGNIMVDSRERVRLIDFGASKQVRAGGANTTSTSMAYTPGYAPREQMEQSMDKFGPWTDLYALGATVYHLLTGNTPPMPSDIDDEGEGAFSFPASVSGEMRALVRWLMNTDRRARPQTDTEVLTRLAGQPAAAPATPADEVTVIRDRNAGTAGVVNGERLKVNDRSDKSGNSGNSGSKLLPLAAAAVVALVVFAGIMLTRGTDGAEDTGAETTDVAVDSASVPSSFFDEVYDSAGVAVSYRSNLVCTYDLDGSKFTYTGQVKPETGIPDGQGVARWADGRVYEGHFADGKMDGQGVFTDTEGKYRFEGAMRGGRFEQGTMTYTDDNSRFAGTFRDGAPWNGTYTTAAGERQKVVNGQ